MKVGQQVYDSLSQFQTIDDHQLADLKQKVKNVLEPIIKFDAPTIFMVPNRIPQNIELPLKGYDLYISETRSLPRYRIKISGPDGLIIKAVKEIENIDGDDAIDESVGYPLILNAEWEIRYDGEAFFYNNFTQTKSALRVKMPNHNGTELPEEDYNLQFSNRMKLLSDDPTQRNNHMKFFRLLGHDIGNDKFALAIANHNYGIDIIPCIALPILGLIVISDFGGIYDEPRPIAGKIDESGCELLYRFHTDEPLEIPVYESEIKVDGLVSFADIPMYKTNNSKWISVLNKKSFDGLKPLIRNPFFGEAVFRCDVCGKEPMDLKSFYSCQKCFDYTMCNGCQCDHEHQDSLALCHSFDDYVNSTVVTYV